MKVLQFRVLGVLLATGSLATDKPANPTPAALQQAILVLQRAEQISSNAIQWNRPFLLSKIAQALFLAGATDETKTVLRRAWDSFPSDADPKRRAWILVNTMAHAQASVGDNAGARDCIEHMKEVVAGVPEAMQDSMLVEQIASVQIEIGDLAEAEQTVQLLPAADSARRNQVGELAAVCVRSGDLAGARRYARGLEDSLASEVLQHIMAAQIESGDLAAAAETASSIPSSGFQASARANLAVAQFHAGNPKAATANLSRALKMASGGDAALKDVAMAEAGMGDFAAATMTVSSIKDHDYLPKSEWFADLALLAFKSNHEGLVPDLLSRAMESTKLFLDDKARSMHAQQVMLVRAETGDVPAALEFAAELPDDFRIRFLDQIATIQAKAGDITGAERTASQIPDPYAMPSAGEIALAKVKTKDFAGASQTAKWQEAAQLETLRAQTRAGDLAGALSEVDNLRAPKMQVDALVGIARGLLEGPAPGESNSPRDSAH
jgi:tetratricopeptide (TPR) repeat protein